jgi:hypothetical protein
VGLIDREVLFVNMKLYLENTVNALTAFVDLTIRSFFQCPRVMMTVNYPGIIVNDDQEDATNLTYLFIPNQLYMFRAMFSPKIGALDCIYSFCYCTPTLLPTGVMDEIEFSFHLIHDTSRQRYRWTISEAVNIIMCS